MENCDFTMSISWASGLPFHGNAGGHRGTITVSNPGMASSRYTRTLSHRGPNTGALATVDTPNVSREHGCGSRVPQRADQPSWHVPCPRLRSDKESPFRFLLESKRMHGYSTCECV